MQKYLLVALLIFSIVFLSGCTSLSTNKLVGTWNVQNLATYTFYNDNTFTVQGAFGSEAGTYQMGTNDITLSGTDGAVIHYTMKFIGDNAVVLTKDNGESATLIRK